jgi:hypothetical protein
MKYKYSIFIFHGSVIPLKKNINSVQENIPVTMVLIPTYRQYYNPGVDTQDDMPGPLARCSVLSTEDEWI